MADQRPADANPAPYRAGDMPYDKDAPPSRRPAEAGGPAEYDSDPQTGATQLPQPKENNAPDSSGDAPIHGSR